MNPQEICTSRMKNHKQDFSLRKKRIDESNKNNITTQFVTERVEQWNKKMLVELEMCEKKVGNARIYLRSEQPLVHSKVNITTAKEDYVKARIVCRSASDAVLRSTVTARLKIKQEERYQRWQERQAYRFPVFHWSERDKFPSELNLCVGGNGKHTQHFIIAGRSALHILQVVSNWMQDTRYRGWMRWTLDGNVGRETGKHRKTFTHQMISHFWTFGGEINWSRHYLTTFWLLFSICINHQMQELKLPNI